ncbi:NAD(P)/FAD-dependent oxidoreductase [bacterium]|nr:NAD(P)/FAD-dependent oxidoreductase [bacterium]
MKNNKKIYDVVIIGASVAGLSTATKLIQRGIKPIIFERKSTIGFPVQCAEYIPAAFSLTTKSFIPAIAQNVDGLETHIIGYNGEFHQDYIQQKGHILYRNIWEQILATDILKKGAKLFLSEPIINIKYDNDIVYIETYKRNIFAKIIVGADGPQSLVSMFAGLQSQKIMPAIQWCVPLKKRLDRNYILFHPEIIGGYGWLFPKGDIANLGIGAWGVSNSKLSIIAKYFSEFIYEKKISISGGLIPVYGMRELICRNNFIFVGDSAGLTDPITGAGIANAYESGQLAGDTIADYLNDKINNLDVYTVKMKFLRLCLERSKNKRLDMESKWNNEKGFIENIEGNWIHSR